MKKRKITALLMTALFLISCFAPLMTVKGDDYVIDVVKGASKVIEAEPGKKIHVRLPVYAVFGFIANPAIYIVPPGGSPYTTSPVSLTKDNTQGDITYITSYDTTYLEFDVEVKETVKIGYYDLPITFEYEDTLNEGGKKTVQINLKLHIKNEKKPSQLTIQKIDYLQDDAFVGNTFDMTFTIKNEGEITALNTYFSLDYGTTGISPAYTVDSHKIGDLKGGATSQITLPVTILPTAEEGFKSITANFTYKDIEGTAGNDSRNLFITIQKSSTGASENAKLSISGESYQKDIKAGTNYNLTALVENLGAKAASNVKVSIAEGVGAAAGILPGFNKTEISLADIQAGKKQSVEIPLIISSSAAAGLHELTLQVSYTDTDNISRSAVSKVYLMVEADNTEEDEVSGIDFSDVTQKPENPIVGEKVTVSFIITNTGKTDITNIRLWGEELSSSNFEPLDSEPYQKEGSLKAGESKTCSMAFNVGNMISEGLNTLKIGYSYDDGSTALKTGTVSFHVRNVKNDSNSKPKLILTDFGTNTDEIRAGASFIFNFDLKNTHISKAAKNIKVTLSSENEVFSATQGSTSFYVDKIDPSEIYTGSVELRAKSDVATGAYELKIEVEYEYDNMSAPDIEKGGVTDSNPIKLPVIENARPVVQNTTVYNWYEPITINQVSTMTFNFYNMGKSTLSNVYFTLEGDFEFAPGESTYYGSAAPGGNDYFEYGVIPVNEGTCGGTINVHYEDSNGNEVVKAFEFSDIFVQPEQVNNDMNPLPEGDYIPADVMPIEKVKEDIVSLWLFIAIQAAILIIIIPVARIIVIKLHKRKLIKNENNEI